MSTTPTRPSYAGSIRWVDEMIPPIKKGIILIAGSKATIMDRATGDGNKPIQVDVMQHVDFSEEGDRIRLKGESLFARRKIHADDIQVEVIMDLAKCKNC